MLCTKFQVFRSKTVTGSFRTYIHTDKHTYGQTYIHTYRGPKQGKPGRNRNSSQGSVLVSGHYWFVKQCWLVNITGLYRVQVSEKYRFLPQRFNTRIKATRCETLRTVTTNNSKKHSHLTYCLNVSLMVQKWTATIFSTSEPILLIVHENDLFWYVTTNI